MNKKTNLKKKEKLIDIASELFSQNDFHQVAMDDIAIKANVGKGTIYNFFKSKEDLYFSIIEFRMNKLIDILEKAFDDRDDTLANLRSFVIHLHKFFAKYPHFYQIWQKEEAAIDRKAHEGLCGLKERLLQTAVNIVRKGQENGVFRNDIDSTFLGNYIIKSVSALEKKKENVYKKEEALAKILLVFLHGIGTEKVPDYLEFTSHKHEHSTDKALS